VEVDPTPRDIRLQRMQALDLAEPSPVGAFQRAQTAAIHVQCIDYGFRACQLPQRQRKCPFAGAQVRPGPTGPDPSGLQEPHVISVLHGGPDSVMGGRRV